MADIANDVVCANPDCAHLASAHTDLDSGANTGACTMANCTCPAMVTGTGAPVANSTKIVTMADAGAPSGAAPSGSDPSALAQQLDQILDQVTAAAASIDLTTLDPQYQSFIGLANAASATVDLLLTALGAADVDAMAAADTALDPGQTTSQLAEAVDAAIVAARNIVEGSPDDLPEAIAPLAALIQQADDVSGDLLAALNLPDPDVENGDDPSATPNDEPADMASQGGQTFADAPLPDPPADPPPADDQSQLFTVPVMVLEGVDTGDGRFITPGALTWRDLPLSVMAMTETSEWGHEGAQLVGRLDTIERIDASALINAKTGEAYGPGVQALKATGTFTSFEVAAQVAEMVRGGFLRGVSIDASDIVSELEVIGDDGQVVEIDPDDEDALWDAMFDGNVRENVIEGRVMGLTICPFPAFEGAYIVMDDGTSTPAVQAAASPSKSHALNVTDEFGARTCVPCEEGMPLLASAGPMTPPKAWFTDPGLDAPTPLVITDDGRVYGHLAAWSTCHTGITGRCTTAPKSKNDYSSFHVGALKTLDGDVIAVGHITMGTGHAALNLDAGPAAAHYDNTGSVCADVCVGEDAHGIWVAGATRPDLTELALRQLRSSALSGDWRQIGRGLELVAALAVNVPGFPLPRARVASAATVSLVAAGGQQLLNNALGAGTAELADLRRWQASVQPFLTKLLNERADAARERFLATRASAARARVHANI